MKVLLVHILVGPCEAIEGFNWHGADLNISNLLDYMAQIKIIIHSRTVVYDI